MCYRFKLRFTSELAQTEESKNHAHRAMISMMIMTKSSAVHVATMHMSWSVHIESQLCCSLMTISADLIVGLYVFIDR